MSKPEPTFTTTARRSLYIGLLAGAIIGLAVGIVFAIAYYNTIGVIPSQPDYVIQVPKLYASMTIDRIVVSTAVNASRIFFHINATGGRPYHCCGTLDEYQITGYPYPGPGAMFIVPSGFSSNFVVQQSTGNFTMNFFVGDEPQNCGNPSYFSPCPLTSNYYTGQIISFDKVVQL